MNWRAVVVAVALILMLLTLLATQERATPQALNYSELHDVVTRNTQRIIELEHDVRVLEDWHSATEKMLSEHSVSDAVKFAELQTTVHTHERLLWVLVGAIVMVGVETLWRIIKSNKSR